MLSLLIHLLLQSLVISITNLYPQGHWQDDYSISEWDPSETVSGNVFPTYHGWFHRPIGSAGWRNLSRYFSQPFDSTITISYTFIWGCDMEGLNEKGEWHDYGYTFINDKQYFDNTYQGNSPSDYDPEVQWEVRDTEITRHCADNQQNGQNTGYGLNGTFTFNASANTEWLLNFQTYDTGDAPNNPTPTPLRAEDYWGVTNLEIYTKYINTPSPTTAIPSNSPSISPTTISPTTSTPTTSTPTTTAPTTDFPTTSHPTSAAPSTSLPTTASPTTTAPSTSLPSTFAPTTSVPTTAEPTTGAPTTASPSTYPPTTSVPTMYPSTATPTTSGPTYIISVGKGNMDHEVKETTKNTAATIETTLDEYTALNGGDDETKSNAIIIILAIVIIILLLCICCMLLVYIICKISKKKRKKDDEIVISKSMAMASEGEGRINETTDMNSPSITSTVSDFNPGGAPMNSRVASMELGKIGRNNINPRNDPTVSVFSMNSNANSMKNPGVIPMERVVSLSAVSEVKMEVGQITTNNFDEEGSSETDDEDDDMFGGQGNVTQGNTIMTPPGNFNVE